MAKHLLIEIGCEELPPKSLLELSNAFENVFVGLLAKDGLQHGAVKSFATPRRLAIVIHDLDEQQNDREELKLGPAVSAAFDKEGNPSKAAEGFARSNNTTVDKLSRAAGDKGERLAYKAVMIGKPSSELISSHISEALDKLPIAKRMRWGSQRNEFVRPIKWVTIVFGDTTINTEILGIPSSNVSYGHRFMAPLSFTVNADTYESALHKHYVIADITQRKNLIVTQAQQQAQAINGEAQISSSLLDEVAALVEWPIAITGKFDEHFLSVPAEALISSMAGHQKYFHIVNDKKQLLPYFITIANLESQDMVQVIEGNERVIRPRLSDAAFFFETDKKTSLLQRREQLKTIVFQKDLGSIYDKTQRVSYLAGIIAQTIGSDVEKAKRAGLLSKSDLVSEMVLEFDDLQGLMGKYYALNDAEDAEVAQALYEQYLPTGSSEDLPNTLTGCAIALADRIDTLIGIFGIGQQPTGNKDPFALRRATLGIINIIINKSLDLDLQHLYQLAFEQHKNLSVTDTVARALDYTTERFRAHYQAQNIATEIYLAVAAKAIYKPLDFDRRVHAVNQFSKTDAANTLAAANKRVANILAKQDAISLSSPINHSLLIDKAEIDLVKSLDEKMPAIAASANDNNYNEVLTILSQLNTEINTFFDDVMVMADDEKLRNNRLAILQQLRQIFLLVADISLLVAK
jgi:glycyl-tRNA synthetase beta chain